MAELTEYDQEILEQMRTRKWICSLCGDTRGGHTEYRVGLACMPKPKVHTSATKK